MGNSDREEIFENIDNYRIGLDDTFTFKCHACGKCCRNREDILLNARDIFNIAIVKELSTVQVVGKYCDSYIGQTSKFPIIRLKPIGFNKVCPLLDRSKCSVHDKKPAVCAMYPIGRYIEYADDENEANEIKYILMQISCGSTNRVKHTVREWLSMFQIALDDPFFIIWNKAFMDVSRQIRKIDDNEVLDRIYKIIFIKFYIEYDLEKDLLEQFQKNYEDVLSLISDYNSYFVKE